MAIKEVIIKFAFLQCFLFFGCAGKPQMSKTNVIELKGNPTTGYTWSYQISDESLFEVSSSEKYLGEKNIVGAPSLFKYEIKGLKSGIGQITFEYKRPWETTAEPEELRVYEIIIDKDKSVKIRQIS